MLTQRYANVHHVRSSVCTDRGAEYGILSRWGGKKTRPLNFLINLRDPHNFYRNSRIPSEYHQTETPVAIVPFRDIRIAVAL